MHSRSVLALSGARSIRAGLVAGLARAAPLAVPALRAAPRLVHTSVCLRADEAPAEPAAATAAGGAAPWLADLDLPANLILSDASVLEPVVPAPASDAVVTETPLWSFATGASTGQVLPLDSSVWGAPLRPDIVQRLVRWQLANRRTGTSKAKTISEVSGGGRKPYPQKGTGRARLGSIRSPQMRGGNTIHGPKVRDWTFDVPKKVRALGMRVVLSSKARDGRLWIVDSLRVPTTKTGDLVDTLKRFDTGVKGKTLADASTSFVGLSDELWGTNFDYAVGNLHHIKLLTDKSANVYDLVRRENLVLTRKAFDALTARLKPL